MNAFWRLRSRSAASPAVGSSGDSRGARGRGALLGWRTFAVGCLAAALPTHAAESGAPSTAADVDARPWLVIAGAGGRLGRELLRQVDPQRYRIRALSSDPERSRRELGAARYTRAQWLRTDVRDAAQVERALQGATFVISTIGAREFSGAAGPQFIDYQGNVRLADAAVRAGVRHLVLISSGPAGSHRDQSTDAVMGHIRLWKTMAEEHLKASGLSYTIVGPGGLSDVPARREGVAVIPRAQYRSTEVSRADVARIVLDALVNPDAARKSFAVVGNRPGDPEAWRAALRALPGDVGRDVPIEALRFLAGHWFAENGDTVTEEVWSAPRAGLMVGVNHSTRTPGAGERARRSFEYLRIEQPRDGGLTLLASPNGRHPPTAFRLTTWDADGGRAIFTRLDDDFPKLVTYQRTDGGLRARVDGADPERGRLEQSWDFRRRD
jgi:uncharacterized protein YbjT (DUF2867 family)